MAANMKETARKNISAEFRRIGADQFLVDAAIALQLAEWVLSLAISPALRMRHGEALIDPEYLIGMAERNLTNAKDALAAWREKQRWCR